MPWDWVTSRHTYLCLHLSSRSNGYIVSDGYSSVLPLIINKTGDFEIYDKVIVWDRAEKLIAQRDGVGLIQLLENQRLDNSREFPHIMIHFAQKDDLPFRVAMQVYAAAGKELCLGIG
jgi:hypothetical protein